MFKRTFRFFLSSLTVAFTFAAVDATAGQEGDLSGWRKDYPLAYIDRPLANPEGMFELRGNTVFVNLSKGSAGMPVSLAPSLFYGITNEVSFGVYAPVYGLCLSGSSGGCPDVFNDIGFDFQYYALKQGKVLLVPHGGISFSQFQPDPYLEMNLSLLGFIQLSPTLGLFFEPTFSFALDYRSNAHPDRFVLPFLLGYQAVPQVWIYMLTAFGGPIQGFTDGFYVPFGFGGLYSFTNWIDLGLEFQFTNLTPHESSAHKGVLDARALYLRLLVRF